MRRFWLIFAVLFIVVFGTGCRPKKSPPEAPSTAVTNSYLQAAVQDLTGGTQTPFCLAPPGMCPGHFDLSPEQIRSLLNCRILFRFDFQAGLDDKLKRTRIPIVAVEGLAGMCVPETYLQTCRRVLDGLVENDPSNAAAYEDNLTQLSARLRRQAAHCRNQVAGCGLTGAKVLVSRHQQAFAEWLGLEAAASFESADRMTPSDIHACLQAARAGKVQMVIANRQEGTELPARLAQQLNCRLVVFSNFPDTQTGSTGAFERLLKSNLNSLCGTGKP